MAYCSRGANVAADEDGGVLLALKGGVCVAADSNSESSRCPPGSWK